jgi:formiminotetrahydrofolate cyclodeaminase
MATGSIVVKNAEKEIDDIITTHKKKWKKIGAGSGLVQDAINYTYSRVNSSIKYIPDEFTKAKMESTRNALKQEILQADAWVIKMLKLTDRYKSKD